MFLGNLSTNTERQARKTSAKSSIKSEDDKPLTIDPSLRRLSSSEAKGIDYTTEVGKIPRELLLEFLVTCVKMLLEEYNVVEIINDSVESRQGLHLAAVEFQRDVLEHNFGIERNFGCKYLAMLAVHHPDDSEIIEAAKTFMFTCMRSYVNALKYRNKMYKKGQLTRPAENSAMNRSSILEFFEGCNALMVMPETKEELRSIYRSKNQPPNARIIEMQRNLIKLMGYNVEIGVQCLSRVQQDYGTDKEVLMRLQYFMISADLACREATFTDVERNEFYKQIPPLMHHFPHIHILQQRMMAHNQQMNQQHQLDPEARAKEIEALKKSGILGLMATPEGRTKMQDFALRVQESREKASTEVSSWNEERKNDYFSSFLEHPVLNLFGDDGGDPATRLNALFELPPSELEDAMKFIVVISNGSIDLSKKLAEVKGTSNSNIEANLRNVQITLGSLANLKPRNAHNHGPECNHDHSHGHGHSHEHNHNHSQKSWDPLKPDISRGGVSKMER